MRQISGGDAFFLFTDKLARHQHMSMLFLYDQSTVRTGPLRFTTVLENPRGARNAAHYSLRCPAGSRSAGAVLASTR
jgi:hypothetical protein